ncbi:hypothetical protein ST47_g6596 [Ascochyta rabiei]|uniref:Uncharacterized protein n=1 Tax=Didymella rabiei TaxID=5454 RepID=A0A163C7B4_DIDRA|nr:hypothetical protein ST47_g6596 [Ascochyta rabiei]
MKRKFSFNLAPVVSTAPRSQHHVDLLTLAQKIPGKADAAKDRTPEPTPSQHQPQPQPQPQPPPHKDSHSHRRHQSKDDFPHLAAYIDRQPLTAATERELRAACRLILQNFKPSDHGMQDTDPRLDFGAMNRRRPEHKDATPAGANNVRVRMPTGAPVDLKTALEVRRLRAEADAKKKPQQSTLPVRTKSARQRFDDAFADERGRSAANKYVNTKPPPADTLQTRRSQRNRTASADADSLATPMTASTTDACLHPASTAPSSAALTSGATSRRHSRQLDNPAAMADAQAADWMRKELERRRQQNDSPQQPPPPTANRPPSRARSIKDNIKEYIFPGSSAPSRALSRTQSRESLALDDDQEGEPKRTASQRGWRSWGSALRVNSRSNSRPGTRARDSEQEQTKKSQVNLNRELPPLPSLDSWKDELRPQPELSSSHFASVMRAHDKQQGPLSPARSHHTETGSDTLAVQHAQAYPQSPSHSHRSPMYNKQKLDSNKTSPRPDLVDMSQVMTGWSSTSNLAPRNGHISMDTPDHPAFPNAVKLQNNQQQSRLKKVFRGWMLKKEKKEDWMHTIEKEGVKEGVLMQDGGAHSPVVRY